jgi:NADH dehydrogenase
MKSSLFITGSSGFIAGCLLETINPEDYKKIYCLSRNESEIIRGLSHHNNVDFIRGSLDNVDLYKSCLPSTDIVVHLAAVTGKSRREEYFKVNAEGTELLVEQCEQLGVQNFLYVSSIAVKFSEASRYYYAQSKQQGEDAVRNSSLKYTIVRPTIVIGKQSPILKSLSQLAHLPITPVFGDGTAKIQPIYVHDLVDCLFSIIRDNDFQNETFELGGPEVITIENFIKIINHVSNKKDTRTIHIPLKLLVPFLSVLEQLFFSLVPFTVGQLASFHYDSTIEENKLFHKHLPHMKDVGKMLQEVMVIE